MIVSGFLIGRSSGLIEAAKEEITFMIEVSGGRLCATHAHVRARFRALPRLPSPCTRRRGRVLDRRRWTRAAESGTRLAQLLELDPAGAQCPPAQAVLA